MSQTDDFVLFAERIAAGKYYYYQGAGRCDPVRSGYADCSGLVVASLRRVGISIECTGSFALARMGHAAGAGISLDAARRTRGALLYVGTNQGQGGRPGIDPGHVAISRGDGTTVEARNRRAGIGIFDFDHRGWDWTARNHWTSTTPTPPQPTPEPPAQEETDMQVIALVKSGAQPNQQPFGYLAATDRKIWSCWGFQVRWDGQTGDAPLVGTKDPRSIAVPGSAPLVGMEVISSSGDGQTKRFCVYGAQGAEYVGTAHG